ncbi:MAG: SRPBCC family protein [Planctomycetes bacterium]|nr:SRPBCC family protein [Planctomycetota bacterium]
MENISSIEIDRPIEQVFEFTLDHTPEWSLVVVENEVLTETPDGVGSTFRVLTEDRGRKMEFQGVVTYHQPPTASSVNMVGKQFDIFAEYTFEDLGGRTRVCQRSVVTPKGFMKLVFMLLGWMMKKSSCDAAEKELANLKALLEKQD